MQDHQITSIAVECLFGLYTYRLPTDGVLSDVAILYGDNGVGKSTILRLVFHLLSAAGDRGHRSALANAQYSLIKVELGSGVTLSATRTGEPSPQVNLSVKNGHQVLAEWKYDPEARGRRVFDVEFLPSTVLHRKTSQIARREPPQDDERSYLAVLKTHAPTAFILSADRKLDSDAVADPSDEVELRRIMQYREPKRINELVVRSREIALSQALAAAARWINSRVFKGANEGTMNVHTIYQEVLRQIAGTKGRRRDVDRARVKELLVKLEAIESRTSEYARYELAAPLSMGEFRAALELEGKKQLAAGLLEPYVRSLETRLEALGQTYDLVNRFVTTANRLLSDKSIAFRPSAGFTLENRLGAQLEPRHLSSGEQQLLLLFCNVLIARDQPSVFMIDEPELSLNVKWQRELVRALLDLTEGAMTQFLFATHSMELLALHRKRVVRLESARS